jgi:hypothetical protein
MKAFAACLTVLLGSVMAQASLDSKTVLTSFEACSDVTILKNNLSPVQYASYKFDQHRLSLQRMPKADYFRGLSDPRTIKESIQLMKKVAAKKIENIQTRLQYYSVIKSCIQRANNGIPEDCSSLLQEFNDGIRAAVPQLRRELALALNYTTTENYTSIARSHINTSLRAIPSLANPAGGVPMSLSEYRTAEADFAADQVLVEKEVQNLIAETKDNLAQSNPELLANYDEAGQRIAFLKLAYAGQMLQHQANYAKIIASKPHLAFLPNGSLVSKKPLTAQQIVNALDDIERSGRNEIGLIEASMAQGELEFTRLDGEAIWRGYVKGEVELLQFVTSSVMNEVLATNRDDCALAEQLFRRFNAKMLQNFVITNAVFGVGAGAGLLGLTIRGVLRVGHSMGIGEAISVRSAVGVSTRISLSGFAAGDAAYLYRLRAHVKSNHLAVPLKTSENQN